LKINPGITNYSTYENFTVTLPAELLTADTKLFGL